MKEIEPPRGICERILVRIASIQRRIARIKFGALVLVIATTGAVAVPVFQYASEELSQSRFMQYLSLVFSDGGTLLSAWQEFALSLGESLPALGIAAVLITSFIFLGALFLASRTAKSAFLRIQHIS